MTDFRYHNTALVEPADLGRYAALVEAAAPYVTELSAFPLPARVVVRAVTPDQYIDAQAEHNAHLTRLALAGLPAASDAAKRAPALVEEARRAARTAARRFYPLCRAAVIIHESADPELTIIPEVYDRHLHPTGRQLITVFAHQLTALALYAHYPELAWAQRRCNALDSTLPTHQRRRPAALVPGYGQYVERLVAKALGGPAVTGPLPDEPQPSDLYTQLLADPDSPANARQVDQGEQVAVALLDAGGHPLLHLALGREALYPTVADLKDPAKWLTRHQAAVTQTTETNSGTAGDR
ncbi:hypothetical protein DR950_17995 [Kitasatospora xanthocidica]|uniref:Uncharacterized protein n=1 Tax=Kitasatospora xanthocidica TaxID=83382 RepID=A0A372ZU69_9ACTN|nr:hypothetical protein [Kitasatospora xanthocidica]RGD59433.1 hypothetical protein DR950_17995 [Kitasatospora xanthocidica]